jgi:hypothetical protein
MTYEEFHESYGQMRNKKLIAIFGKGKAWVYSAAYKWIKDDSDRAERFKTEYKQRSNLEICAEYGLRKGVVASIAELLEISKYEKNPVTREQFQKLYIDENKSAPEIAAELGLEVHQIGNLSRKFRIKKDKESRYTHSISKGRETSIKNGVYERATDARTQTMMIRYGVPNAMNDPRLKAKTYERATAEGIAILNDKKKLIEFIERVPFESRSYAETADAIGCGRETVRRILLNFGLDDMIPQDRHTSYTERQVATWVESLGLEVKRNDNKAIGREIDVFIPSKNMGIELNGAYYHSMKMNKEKLHIANKQRFARRQGVFIMEIWDTEWNDPRQQAIVKDYIKAKLGMIERRVPARKCEVVMVMDKEKSEFLKAYHILGNSADQVAYGLKTKHGELVAVATFGRNYRTAKDVDVHLNRWCTKADTIVQGGFTKVFKHAISENLDWQKVVTHTDLRFSEREKNVHNLNGFKCEKFLNPSPLVLRGGKLYNSLALKKSRIKRDYPHADITKPIAQLIDELNITVVYDCGKSRNVWNRI